MILLPPKYRWSSSRPLLWTASLHVFPNIIPIDTPCVQNCIQQPTLLGFSISVNCITIHPFAQIRNREVISNPSFSLPSPLHFQFIISSTKCISNTGNTTMWGISTHLVHEDIAFPLLFSPELRMEVSLSSKRWYLRNMLMAPLLSPYTAEN